MKTPFVRLTLSRAGIPCAALTFFASRSSGTAVWTGASGTDTNWSTGGNWSGGTGTAGTPGGADDVVFGNALSNVVDGTSANFAGYVSSLTYTNSTSGLFQNTLSATNNFAVIVNPVAAPISSSATYSNGQFSMTVNGDTGPDYIVQRSTNLFDWQNLFTNSAPALPFTFTDTNAASGSMQFYRILLAP